MTDSLKQLVARAPSMIRSILFICAALFIATLQAEQVNVLWIGNSLMAAPLCGEGWMSAMFMCNDNAAHTGVTLACMPRMAGATSLSTHWASGSGFEEFDDPVVRRPSDPWQTDHVARYHYVVLQPYHPSNGGEEQALRNYADLALSHGTIPVLFGVWENPEHYDEDVAMYLRVWDDYKDQGMLYAPLFEAYKSIIDDGKSLEYLFGHDPWHHEGYYGTYVNMCTFYHLFTGYLPTEYPFSSMLSGWCSAVSSVSSEADYLEVMAERALSLYYDLSGTVSINGLKSPASFASNRLGASKISLYTLTGRCLGSLPSGMVSRKNLRPTGIHIAVTPDGVRTIAGP